MLKIYTITCLRLLFLLFVTSITAAAQEQTSIIDSLSTEWSEVKFEADGVINKMAYADTANFMHQKVYPCARCLLRPEVAVALDKANALAAEKELRLVIFDCYRPYPIQYKMYEIVNNPKYVAKPGKGSNHNRGRAIDISLADADGNLLDMGGAFDDFSEVSHPDYKDISRKARKNRRLLAKIMTKAGFSIYPYEWWHFDYKQKTYETSDYIWDCN
ncbi:M15 family metallopeptidase [Flavobacterium psychrotrophum]|uniref:M15 family metallopeptidase n=1 Tax=Flavobacterium psychrotrophum TaxID=2294119 RepID=UPI000E30FD64|nr:M15 family metallopeptidase [Flavobacterium psychrotrophum]